MLHIYNSLTHKHEPFTPITPGHVGMYVCGPTVSGESHLGHARPYITFDVVYRYLTFLGNKVRYVRNITDAGHFEEEGREADDKINTKALLEKLEPMELVQKYTNLFHWAFAQFNCIEPTIEPTATGHIVEQIEMIEKILDAGFGYVANGSVYFDVAKYHEHYSKENMPYGILSNRVLDDMLETTRDLENQDEKQNKADFALWKNAPPEHLMRWKSPWGYGFPGWHIECSAMATKYLGKQFDIHGGGMDLQFPHHECEIAQSNVCNNAMPAKFWMHNNMITVNGKKMGKSYGNTIMLTEMFSGNHPLLEQPYHPMVIRFFILQTHYRSTLNFTNEPLQAAEKGLKRLMDAYALLSKITIANDVAADEALDKNINSLVASLTENLNNDFNTAMVIASLFELVPIINGLKDGHIKPNAITTATWQNMQSQMHIFIVDILGLKPISDDGNKKIEGLMNLLIQIRHDARTAKNYATSDAIRNGLQTVGFVIKDEKDGSASWSGV
jgi:cysteinyl-tRNA synthetase